MLLSYYIYVYDYKQFCGVVHYNKVIGVDLGWKRGQDTNIHGHPGYGRLLYRVDGNSVGRLYWIF